MDRFTLARRRSWAAEEIAKRFGLVEISKALDPTDPDDFILISTRLARALRGAAVGLEGEVLKSAIESLDVDWPNVTEARRDAIITAARAEVAGLYADVAPIVEPVLFNSASMLVPATRKAAIARFDLLEGTGAADWVKNIVGDLRDSQMVYVKDAYGQRADRFDSLAKDIVAKGLEQGLGRDDISAALSTQLTPLGVERGTSYWNLIASDFAAKSRTISQLHTFEDAGIDRYEFDAVMDQATSEICRALNGRIFVVQKARKQLSAALTARDPEDIKNSMPWVGQTGDKLQFSRAGSVHTVGTVEQAGVGAMDKPGVYSGMMSTKQLQAAGICVPPLHAHCRSSIKAVL